LERCACFLFCGMRIYPGTGLYDLALTQGQITAAHDLTEPVYYQSPDLDGRLMAEALRQRAEERIHWVLGSGGPQMTALMARMYQKGYSGPLWEYLCR
jgi:hypothetical protein